MSNYYNDQWRLPNNENKDKQSNYSMDFDGSSQYIDVGTLDFFNASATDFTISLWVKPTSRSYGMPFTTATSFTHSIYIYYAVKNSYNRFEYGIRGSGTQNTVATVTAANDIAPNVWYHVILTSEGTTAKFYLNGSLLHTGTSGTTYFASGNSVKIGRWYAANFEFTGNIDGVSIFNYALSSSQVTTLYGSSSTGIGNPISLSPKPVSYYPLGDQDAFNGAEYLVPNSSLKDYVFDFGTYTDNKYISINNTFDSIITSTNFTISAWFKLNSVASTQYKYIFTNESLQFAITNTVNIYRRGTSGSYLGILTGSTSLNINTWYNAVITKNGNDYTLFLNAQSDSTLYDSLAIANSSETTSRIGMYYQSNIYGLDGKLSNVQIFNTALPATGSNSIETLYNNGSPLTSMSGFTSLQGWWKLDASATYDGSDWTIPDDSTNSNTGTSSGMTQANLVQSDLSFTSGYSPYALDFDGTNDYITLGSGITLADSWSVSIWINTTTTSNNKGILSNGNPSSYDFFTFGPKTKNGRLETYLGGSYVFITPVINDGNWHHLTFAYDHSSTTIKVYTDNSESYSSTSYDNGTSKELKFLARAYIGWYWEGKLSNCSIWNAALTSAQVTEIYSEGKPSNLNNHSAYSNLVSWWQLGSNSSFNTNWTVLDEKGSNNGTSSNMTEDDIVDGVNTYGGGTSSGMGGDEVIGDAPYSSSNSLSVNMDALDRVEDTPS
jgi:hypothetical protein